MKRKFIAPRYYGKFICKGSSCLENCCIGWEIDVDRITLAKYLSIEGKIGEELRKNIVKDGKVSHFCLKSGRCPFLDGRNLCRLIIEGGEEMLCDICREHPRFYVGLAGGYFVGVGLCCEAAAELILTEKEPLGYNLKNEKIRKTAESFISSYNSSEDKKIYSRVLNSLCAMEEELTGEGSLRGAVGTVIKTAEKLQSELDEISYGVYDSFLGKCGLETYGGESSDKRGAMDCLLLKLRSLDYLTDELLERISCVKPDEVSEFYVKNPDFLGYLRRCIIYFADRYALGSFEDMDAYGRGNLIISLTVVLCLLLTTVEEPTLRCAVRRCTLLSRELEYNEENADRLRSVDSARLIQLLP